MEVEGEVKGRCNAGEGERYLLRELQSSFRIQDGLSECNTQFAMFSLSTSAPADCN